MEPIARKAKNYRDAAGRSPFREWILRKLDGGPRQDHRQNQANRGVWGLRRLRAMGNGVYELRFDVGPGYRVYFGIDGDEIILLGGGDKSTQGPDIRKARKRWEEYDA